MGDTNIGTGVPTFRVIEAAVQEAAFFALRSQHALGYSGDTLVVLSQAEVRQHTELPYRILGIVSFAQGLFGRPCFEGRKERLYQRVGLHGVVGSGCLGTGADARQINKNVVY